jgi:diguanylate cyclase (GGDEF)-like protein
MERRRGMLALLFLDLDHFKRINDTFGHQVGDLLLQQVAGRLSHCVRESDCVSRTPEGGDTSTVSRLGGDEFMVLLSEVRDAQDAARVAERMLKVLAMPFGLGENEVVVGASIGITVGPSDGGDVNTLMRNGDAAMYGAKEAGRNNYKFYEANMNAVARRRLKLEGELRKALARGELHLHYQPKVKVETLEISGFEALLRWDHPTLGRVPPNEFIPVAEEGGLIGSVGEFVIRSACLQARAWLDAKLSPPRIAVNLSPHQFKEGGIAEVIASILAETSVSPRCLDLEITESALMESEAIAVSALERLQRIGITVSLDDFGTGYSSLSYLKRFPVDAVKIDRSFIRDCETNADDAALAATIISMGKTLNLKVVAEGVETEEQLTFLRQHGCHEMQGYWFSPPVPAEEATELLRRHRAGGTGKPDPVS